MIKLFCSPDRSTLARLCRVVSLLSFVACASYFLRLSSSYARLSNSYARLSSYPVYDRTKAAADEMCREAMRGNLEKIDSLKGTGVPLDKPCWTGDQTPLSVAVDQGDPITTAFLLQKGVDPNNAGSSETTPLRLALWRLNNLEVTRVRDAETEKRERDYRRIVRLLKEAGGREYASQ